MKAKFYDKFYSFFNCYLYRQVFIKNVEILIQNVIVRG